MNPATLLTLARQWWKFGAGLILGFILCWPVASCSGRHEQSKLDRAAIDRANTAALQQKARADELAAQQRLVDQRATDNLERNLANAVANIPDAVPTARRLARACAQLRSQGLDTANLPQCGGPSGSAQAAASR